LDGIRSRWTLKTLPNLVKFSLGFIVFCIFIAAFFIYRLRWVAAEYGAEASALNPNNQIFFHSSILVYVTGWILLLLFLKRSRQKDGIRKKSLRLFYAAFIFIAFAQILDRYLFFSSFYRIGL
jgi:uncharacterized membrane protein YidH (DUF202 family)